MDAARAERQRVAIESLMQEQNTRKVYMAFLRASQSLGAFTIEDVLADLT